MIRSTSYFSALQFADELAQSGIYISPVAESVLSALVEASASTMTVKTTELPAVLTNGSTHWGNSLILDAGTRAWQVENATGDHEESSVHSKTLAAMADDIGPYVLSHLSYARNTVKPKVVELAQAMEHYLEVTKTADPSSEFEIIQACIPEILQDESFLAGGLENYTGNYKDPKWPSFKITLPDHDDFFKVATRLGNDRLSALFDKFINSFGGIKFVKECVYQSLPVEKVAAPYNKNADIYYVAMSPYRSMAVGLINYVVGNYLLNNVASSTAKSLTDYKFALRDVIDFNGSIVMKGVRTLKRLESTNTLVVEMVISEKKITVCKGVYKQLLEQGGCPEMLLGMLARGQAVFNLTAVSEQREALLTSWNAYLSMAQSDLRAAAKKNFYSFIQSKALSDLEELDDAELEFFGNKANAIASIEENINKQLDHLGHRLMDDIYHTALHVVAKGRYYYTSAYGILNEMAEAAKINPEIDPREAGLVSAIIYFTEYLFAQTSHNRIT